MSLRNSKHRAWHKQLKDYLSNIQWCERCGQGGILDIAHRSKRRFIGVKTDLDENEYFMAAVLCRSCHRMYDEAGGIDDSELDTHERMFSEITKIILDRDGSLVRGQPIRPMVTDYYAFRALKK